MVVATAVVCGTCCDGVHGASTDAGEVVLVVPLVVGDQEVQRSCSGAFEGA